MTQTSKDLISLWAVVVVGIFNLFVAIVLRTDILMWTAAIAFGGPMLRAFRMIPIVNRVRKAAKS